MTLTVTTRGQGERTAAGRVRRGASEEQSVQAGIHTEYIHVKLLVYYQV